MSEARAWDAANAGLLEQQRAVVCIRNETFLTSFFDELFWKFDIWESVHSALERSLRGLKLNFGRRKKGLNPAGKGTTSDNLLVTLPGGVKLVKMVERDKIE